MPLRGDIVHVLVSVADDSGEEFGSLHTWLTEEPAVRRHGRLRVEGDRAAAGTMGVIEVMSLVVGSGLSLTQLINLIVGWRATRRRAVQVRVQVGSRVAEVHAASVDEVPAMVRQLEASLADGGEVG